MSCTGRSSHGLTDADLLGETMSETAIISLAVYEADRSAREACMEIVAQYQCGECDAALKIIDAIRRTITPSPAAREVERLKREVDTAEKQRDNLYFEVERLRAENEKLWRAVKAWEAESLERPTRSEVES